MFELVETRLFAYADDSTLLAVVRRPADRPAVDASLNRDLARIQEWWNHFCIILNPDKTKALVVSRSRTVNPPHGNLVLSGVSNRAGPSLDIQGLKFDSKLTFEDHVRVIVSRVPQIIDILMLVKRIFVDTSVLLRCYFAFVLPIVEYCSPMWGSAAECHIQLLERHSASASFHLLVLEFDIPELRPQLIHWSLKYQCVERPKLLGLSCRLRFDFGMTFVTLCLIPERWMGPWVQSTVGCFPKLCFHQFSVAQVLVGLRKQFITNFDFPTWACAAGFNNNNNNNNISLFVI